MADSAQQIDQLTDWVSRHLPIVDSGPNPVLNWRKNGCERT